MFCAYVCCSLFHSPYPLVFFALCVLPDIFFRHCIATFVCRSCAWTRPFMGIINFLPYLRGEWYIKYHISDSCVSDTCYGVIRKSGKKLNTPIHAVAGCGHAHPVGVWRRPAMVVLWWLNV